MAGMEVIPFWTSQPQRYQNRHYFDPAWHGSSKYYHFSQSTQKQSNSELLWSAMEVIPFWPSQHQEISKLALHRTPRISSQFPCRLVSVLYGLRFLVGVVRVGSCSTVRFGSVRFVGTLYNGMSYGFERCSHSHLHSLWTAFPHNEVWKNRQKSGVVYLFQHDNSLKRP